MFASVGASAANSAASSVAAFIVIALVIAYFAFFIAALVSIIGSTNYTSGLKALWVLACFAFPFIGSLVWFVWGKNGNS